MKKAVEIRQAKKNRAALLLRFNRLVKADPDYTQAEFAVLIGVSTARIWTQLSKARAEA